MNEDLDRLREMERIDKDLQSKQIEAFSLSKKETELYNSNPFNPVVGMRLSITKPDEKVVPKRKNSESSKVQESVNETDTSMDSNGLAMLEEQNEDLL